MKLFSWFKRSVTIELADVDREVVWIKIDPADGSVPQELYLNRNNTFSLAAVVLNIVRNNPGIHDLSFTMRIPIAGQEEDEVREMKIPNWAQKQFVKKIAHVAFNQLHWNGICPKPAKKYAFR
ncbi:MAG TPA: hypothetical protein VM577_18640 [Anaerovoracaceae bacterium]|nr:hypothetical protein [Anaerovoracaceae bacterium]